MKTGGRGGIKIRHYPRREQNFLRNEKIRSLSADSTQVHPDPQTLSFKQDKEMQSRGGRFKKISIFLNLEHKDLQLLPRPFPEKTSPPTRFQEQTRRIHDDDDDGGNAKPGGGGGGRGWNHEGTERVGGRAKAEEKEDAGAAGR